MAILFSNYLTVLSLDFEESLNILGENGVGLILIFYLLVIP